MKKIYILLGLFCLFILAGCNKHHFKVIEYIEPTCTLDGKEVKECTKCKEQVTTILEAKGHYFKNKQCDNCDTLASYELIETIIYKDILSQKEDKYYIFIYRDNCEVCKSMTNKVVNYYYQGNVRMYALNRSNTVDNQDMTAPSGTTTNVGLNATVYTEVKLCSTPVLLEVTNGVVTKLIDMKTLIFNELEEE